MIMIERFPFVMFIMAGGIILFSYMPLADMALAQPLQTVSTVIIHEVTLIPVDIFSFSFASPLAVDPFGGTASGCPSYV